MKIEDYAKLIRSGGDIGELADAVLDSVSFREPEKQPLAELRQEIIAALVALTNHYAAAILRLQAKLTGRLE